MPEDYSITRTKMSTWFLPALGHHCKFQIQRCEAWRNLSILHYFAASLCSWQRFRLQNFSTRQADNCWQWHNALHQYRLSNNISLTLWDFERCWKSTGKYFLELDHWHQSYCITMEAAYSTKYMKLGVHGPWSLITSSLGAREISYQEWYNLVALADRWNMKPWCWFAVLLEPFLGLP